MTKESIKNLLETMRQYNDVQITQIFTKGETDWIRVKCIPDTHLLELTYLQTETAECFESVDEAVQVIEKTIYSRTTA